MRTAPRLLALVAFTLGLALVPARAEPQPAFHLEARLPASTLAFVSLEEVGSWRARIEKTSLGRLMADPEMQAFLAPARAAFEEMLRAQMDKVPPVVFDLLDQMQNLKGQLAVALVSVGDEGPEIVASLDFREHAEDFRTFLGRVKDELDPEGHSVRVTMEHGRPWWTVDAGEVEVHATIAGGAFVASTHRDRLERVVAGPSEASLAALPAFQAVRRSVGGDAASMVAFGNVVEAIERFGDRIDDETLGIANALGLDTVHAVGYGMAMAEEGFLDTVVVHAPNADHGLIPLLRAEPLGRPRSLGLVPATAFAWAEANLPLADLLPRVRGLLRKVEPDAARSMDEALAEMRRTLGVDLEKDVAGGLDGAFAYYAALPETGGLFPEVAVMLRPKDPAAYEGTFARLADGLASLLNQEGDVLASTRTMEYAGTRLHLFEMQAARGRDVVPFTPTWAIVGEHLVVTLVPHAMKELLLRRAEGGPGLAGQPDFKALLRHAPPGASAMEYLDMKAMLALLYDTAVPVLQTAAKPNVVPVPVDWALLPPARKVVPHFQSLAGFGVVGDEGLLSRYVSPIPVLPLYLGAMAVVWAAPARPAPSWVGQVPMMPEPSDFEREMDVQLAQVQADMLLEAVEFYRATKERVPASLDDLVRAGLLDSVPQDPWGGSYRLRTDPTSQRVMVESAGPDRSFGTEDDVRKWTE